MVIEQRYQPPFSSRLACMTKVGGLTDSEGTVSSLMESQCAGYSLAQKYDGCQQRKTKSLYIVKLFQVVPQLSYVQKST